MRCFFGVFGTFSPRSLFLALVRGVQPFAALFGLSVLSSCLNFCGDACAYSTFLGVVDLGFAFVGVLKIPAVFFLGVLAGGGRDGGAVTS